ncbi:MAG: glycosyltransferase family 2 protein [Bacteriovoracaceae bacterium]
MLISIVTPTFNSEKTIVGLIESVCSQTYKNWEHIIVDNVSNDQTLSLIEKTYQKHGLKNYKVISEPDKGITDAFNKGVKNSSGDLITILNSDDYFYSEKVLESSLKAFEDPEVMFSHGDIYFEDEEFGSNIRGPLLCPIHYAMPFNHPGMIIRKSLYDEIGIFSEDFKLAMDFEWICRLYNIDGTLKYKSVYLDDFGPLVFMRGGGASQVHEEKGLIEMQKALELHKLWNDEAISFFKNRRLRMKVRNLLQKLGLNSFVSLWRNMKWKKSESQ